MPRFDVYANPDAAERKLIPCFLDVQNDFLEGLETRVVVPLWAPAAFRQSVRNLNPVLQVEDRPYIMDTAGIGAVPIADLRRPLDNIASQQLAIQDALDTLFGSY